MGSWRLTLDCQRYTRNQKVNDEDINRDKVATCSVAYGTATINNLMRLPS